MTFPATPVPVTAGPTPVPGGTPYPTAPVVTTVQPQPARPPVPTAPQQGADHGPIIATTDPKFAGNPQFLNPVTGDPLPSANPIPMRIWVTYADGAEVEYEYDHNHPPDLLGGGAPGRATGATRVNWKVVQANKDAAVAANKPPGKAQIIKGEKGQPSYILNPDGSMVQVQEPVLPNLHFERQGDGSVLMINPQTGVSDFLRYDDGEIVKDQAAIDAALLARGVSQEQIAASISTRQREDTKLGLFAQNQAYTQGQQQFLNAQTIQQNAATGAANDLNAQLNLLVTQPQAAAANERAANLARSNEAVQRISAAVNGQTVANTGGANAVSDAQWMLQHSGTPEFVRQVGQVQSNPGLLPNFAAPGMTVPMPDLQAIRRAGQDEARAFVPDFSSALAASQAQPTAPYPMDYLWDQYLQRQPLINLYTPMNGNPYQPAMMPYPTDNHPYVLAHPPEEEDPQTKLRRELMAQPLAVDSPYAYGGMFR